jgi:hypothetical protein
MRQPLPLEFEACPFLLFKLPSNYRQRLKERKTMMGFVGELIEFCGATSPIGGGARLFTAAYWYGELAPK